MSPAGSAGWRGDADRDRSEPLSWVGALNPAYLKDDVRLWMLQAFKQHCSLRFPPGWFGAHRAEVEAAGFVNPSGRRRSLTRDRPRRCRRNLGTACTGEPSSTCARRNCPALPGIAT